MGRKVQYKIEDLPTDFYDRIISWMREEGMSKKEVCSELNVSASAHARFLKESEEYKEAFEIGKSFAEAWWMKQGRKNLENKGFNVGIYAFQMKNRFKWRDTPLVVQGEERTLADKYKEKEIIGKYKKTGEQTDEKIIN